MTDTDNTQESAVAYYGDIVFKKAVGNKPSTSTSPHPSFTKEGNRR